MYFVKITWPSIGLFQAIAQGRQGRMRKKMIRTMVDYLDNFVREYEKVQLNG